MLESRAVENKHGGAYAAIGWIFAIVSLFVYPFIFGVLGVVMGIIATKKESKSGLTAIVASVVFMAIGLMFSSVLLNYIRPITGR